MFHSSEDKAKKKKKQPDVSQAKGQFVGCLPQVPATWKWVLVIAVLPNYMDGSTAGDHEIFEHPDQEMQYLVRLEVEWASFFGSSSC